MKISGTVKDSAVLRAIFSIRRKYLSLEAATPQLFYSSRIFYVIKRVALIPGNLSPLCRLPLRRFASCRAAFLNSRMRDLFLTAASFIRNKPLNIINSSAAALLYKRAAGCFCAAFPRSIGLFLLSAVILNALLILLTKQEVNVFGWAARGIYLIAGIACLFRASNLKACQTGN